MKDYLNRKGKRNRYNTDETSYNCGGYALDTYSWYYPYDDWDDIIDDVDCMFDDGYSIDEVNSTLIERFTDKILEDFPEYKVINPDLIDNYSNLIAFRIGAAYTDYYDSYIEAFDFHFKKKINNKWYEKRGRQPIEECNLVKNYPWETAVSYYDSEIIYFAK